MSREKCPQHMLISCYSMARRLVPARHLPAMLRPPAIARHERAGNASFRILPRSRDGAELGSGREGCQGQGGMSFQPLKMRHEGQVSTGCFPNPLATPSRVMLPFLKCLVARDELGRVGGRRPFHGLSAGETAVPPIGRETRRGQESPADKS